MNKKEKDYAEAMATKLLLEAIREEINNDLINAIKDPNYIMQTTPMIFESEEDKRKYKEHYDKVWNSRNDFLKGKEK